MIFFKNIIDNNLHWTDITAMTPLKIQKGNAMFNVTQAGR